MLLLWRLLMLLLGCCVLPTWTQQQQGRKNSKFVWKRPQYAMPWLKGKNVCAVEEVQGTRKRYYSECMTYLPRKICGKPTFIRYHCCTGFERTDPGSSDCTGVVPIEDLMTTAKNLYLKDFRKHVRAADMEELLTQDSEVITLFGPQNIAFNSLDQDTRYLMSSKDREENLLSLHMTKGRYDMSEFYNDQYLPSLLPDLNDPEQKTNIRINRYSNGIVTANCARIVLPNQVASNGIIHVTEKVLTPMEDRGSIIDLLLQDGRFEELVTALIVSGLATELRDPGHFTLIAPTDDAFHSAPEEVLQRILTDKDMLKRLLEYHVLDESYCSAAVIGPISVRSLEGQNVNVTCGVDDTITVNGVPVIDADLLANNGVVHAVEEILIPDAAKSLSERLLDLGLLQFMEYAQSSGLSDLLDGTEGGNYTVFAPTAEAFQKLTREQKRILQTQSNAVKKVFSYHVVPGKFTTKDLKGDQNLITAESTPGEISANIHVKVYQKGFGVNNAKIIDGDNEAGNGVIHIIDRIIFPPDETMQEKIQGNSELSTLMSLLQESGMDRELFASGSNVTIFAPTNDAFDQLESSFIEKLMIDRTEMEKFMKYHLLQKPIYSSGIKPGLNYRFRTTAKEWIRVEQTEEHDPIRINDESLVLVPDIETVNGVIHIVDTVLKCPCVDGLENQI